MTRETEPALSDPDAIAEYIALDKSNAATNLVQKVFSSTERLEQFLDLGRNPPEIKESRYLEIIVGPCRISYRVEADQSVCSLCDEK